jgi:chaperonin GroES
MKPLSNKVLVEVQAPATQTASGLFIQEQWKTLQPIATIVAVGPEVTEVKPGQRIIFERYGAVKVDLPGDDRDLRLTTDKGILAVLDGNDD